MLYQTFISFHYLTTCANLYVSIGFGTRFAKKTLWVYRPARISFGMIDAATH